ncbi:MAG: hypothetical protein AAGB12_03165, partial [Pseudomonadota bacterium]
SIGPWLDPDDTGTLAINGSNGCPVTVSVDVNQPDPNGPAITYAAILSSPLNDPIYQWDFDRDGSIDSQEASGGFTYPDNFVGNVQVTIIEPESGCMTQGSAAITVQSAGLKAAPSFRQKRAVAPESCEAIKTQLSRLPMMIMIEEQPEVQPEQESGDTQQPSPTIPLESSGNSSGGGLFLENLLLLFIMVIWSKVSKKWQ